MTRNTLRPFAAFCAFALPAALIAQEPVDLLAIHKIKAEALENSKVMDHMFYLTDVAGHRLTNSPGYKKAGEWAVKQLQEYGLTNVRLEKWGPFGKGWNYTRFSVHMIEPTYSTLIGFPQAWSPGTNGPVQAEAVEVQIRTEADMEKYKGKLKGKIVLDTPAREVTQSVAPLATRMTDAELAQTALAPEPGQRPFGGAAAAMQQANQPITSQMGIPSASQQFGGGGNGNANQPPGGGAAMQQARQLRMKVAKFWVDEGVVAVVNPGYRGDGGTVFSSSYGNRDQKELPATAIAITPEHYNRMIRLIDKKIPVRMEIDVKAEFVEGDESFNVVGEIPGTTRKDELVMLGAHLDSWHGGTGATDNAAGCSVAMEAVRILMATGLKPKRTVRIALWGGEEEGLLGSRAYVKEHFADRESMKLTSEHARLAGYFNLDNGTGKIRGIYDQGNDMVRPIFEAWLKPFADMGASTVTIRNTGGTDHQSFDGVGLPGFQFVQDGMEYSTRTHHSNMDTYDHISKPDLMQASAIMAAFVYNTAQREEMLPRKPLPKPQPARGEGGERRGVTPTSTNGQ
jgi:carboxypeptidase Q